MPVAPDERTTGQKRSLRKAVVDLHLLRVERHPGRSRLQHQQGGEILIPEAVPHQRLDLLSREVMPALGASATNIHARPLTTRAIVESWNDALAWSWRRVLRIFVIFKLVGSSESAVVQRQAHTDRLPQLVVCLMRTAITGCCEIRIVLSCG